MATQATQSYGTYSTLAVVALQNLSYSTTICWKSTVIDNQTSVGALDYEIFIILPQSTVAPAGDACTYAFACPAIYNGSAWAYSDGGTATLPTSGDSTYTLAATNNLKLLGILNYTTTGQTCQGSFNLSNAVGGSMPDGFILVLKNASGAAYVTGCIVATRSIALTAT